MTLRSLLPALLVALLCGCASVETRPAAQATHDQPAANDQLYAVAWQQTALEYQATARSVYAGARRALAPVVQWHQQAGGSSGAEERAAAVAQLAPWNAMPLAERAGDDSGQPLAIILDADETVIDNSPYQARRIDAGAGFDDASWSAWVAERRAKAVPGAVEFTQWAAGAGIAVFYVTNRSAADGPATADNLRALGFPLPEGEERLLLLDDSRGFGSDKISRRQRVDRDFRVIGLFGDNLGDFLGGVKTDNATRARKLATYRDWWGSRWFMLPNPMYGSWVDATAKYCDGAEQGDARACMRRNLRRQ
jgi:5'-nucleotidase (lipoprotein e(P4) family)